MKFLQNAKVAVACLGGFKTFIIYQLQNWSSLTGLADMGSILKLNSFKGSWSVGLQSRSVLKGFDTSKLVLAR